MPRPYHRMGGTAVSISRKHFNVIATTLHDTLDTAGSNETRTAVEEITVALCAVLAATNPRFDRRRFYTACGLTAEGHLPKEATL